MRKTRSAPVWCMVAAIVALAAAQWRAVTAAGPIAAEPVRVAHIDLEQIINDLEETTVRMEEYNENVEEIRTRIKGKEERYKEIEDGMKALAPGSPELVDMLEQYYMFRGAFEFQKEFGGGEVSVLQGKVWKDLYEKVMAKAQQIANREGYDYVVLHRPQLELKQAPTHDVVMGAIGSRIVVYANPAYDLTDTLINEMNADWRAGK